MFITPRDWPRWVYMWTLAFAIYSACKLLTWSKVPLAVIPHWRQAAYLFAWPGLNARRFFFDDHHSHVERPAPTEWAIAVLTMCGGAVLFWTAHWWIPDRESIALGWAGMVGIVLMLHFGLFRLLSCFWRARGIDARPIMNAPTHSTSITEFWSNRWNTAFRDLTHQFLFVPLARRWGLKAALILGFVLSGVVHDLVISLPAGGGYGRPTLFFLIQGLAIVLERSHVGRVLRLGSGWRGWLFTAFVLLAPVKLLFHDRFVLAVVLPFMKALGAA